MENNLLLKVITPDGTILNEHVQSVSIKALNGELVILKKHASTIGGIENDVIKVKKLSNEIVEYICGEGLFFVADNVLKIVSSFFALNTKENVQAIIDEFDNNIELLTSSNELKNDQGLQMQLLIMNQMKKMKNN
ncbi:MAG: hypothetical protein RSA40_02645 [Malacoplasma sp.]